MMKQCMSVGLALSMLLSLTPITAIHADETQELDVQDTEERKEDLELVPSVSVAGLKAVATEKESITIKSIDDLRKWSTLSKCSDHSCPPSQPYCPNPCFCNSNWRCDKID